MRRLITCIILAGYLVGSAMAGEAAPTWVVTTTVKLSDAVKVTCSLQFPSEKRAASLRLRNPVGKGITTNGSATFDLTVPEALSPDAKTNFSGVAIVVGNQGHWDQLKGAWQASADKKSGRVTIVASPDINAVLGPIGQGVMLTVSVPTRGGDKVYAFALKGSVRAVEEYRACVAR